ncbi:hypothetical protein KIN20_037184 [Parelaphostrongylus tenuis]|uniref:Uncharacterized protein n=1 Tax=Parelaphostrongylus tenuis TaxID=148309 RepID=A0AAD5REC8_PARTN|nr:hypothetical protein KIN20_037184 [Parelaphostrongylus tenuis]
MGERIRLFSAGTFVTTVSPTSAEQMAKTQSLSSFCETGNSLNVPSPSRHPVKRSRLRVVPGSVISLQHNEVVVQSQYQCAASCPCTHSLLKIRLLS